MAIWTKRCRGNERGAGGTAALLLGEAGNYFRRNRALHNRRTPCRTLLVAVFYFLFAANQYESEADFVVKTAAAGQCRVQRRRRCPNDRAFLP